MEFRGILKGCVATRSGKSANGEWERRVYLVEEVASFQKKMVFEVTDGEMGRYKTWDALIGKSVVVRFGIDASEYNGRWYNNIQAWNIWEPKEETEKSAGEASEQAKQAQAEQPAEQNQQAKPAGTVETAQGPFDELMKHDAVAAQAKMLWEFEEHGQSGDDLPF